MDLALAAPYGSPVIGRQEHDHGGAMIQRVLVARHADIGAVMRGRDNDGDAAGHASQNGFGQDAPLFVADGELLREISQYAQAVGTRVDHEVDAAFLPFQVKGSVLMENSRDERVQAERKSTSL